MSNQSSFNNAFTPDGSSPQQSFDLDLQYDLLPAQFAQSPQTLSLHSFGEREASTALRSPYLDEDDDLFGDSPISSSFFDDLEPSTPDNRQPPPIVDLTDSPPLQRRQPMGAAVSTTWSLPTDLTGSHAAAHATDLNMPPRRRRQSLRRASNTQDTTASSSQPRRRPARTISSTPSHGESPVTQSSRSDAQRPAKRRRVGSSPRQNGQPSQATSTQAASTPIDVEIEEFDLTEVTDPTSLAKALSKQREDAVKAAQKPNNAEEDEGRTVLTAYKCPICMDVLEDATSTVCGHLFCHKCIIETLRFSEMQRAEESVGKAKGTCPVCRKPMIRSDKADRTRTLVPLALKLQVVKRSVVGKGKGKEVEHVPKREHSTLSV